MNIIFIGPPGSGKSTQAKLLSQKFGLFFIQMGKEIRRAAQKKSAWGKKIKKQIEKGELVKDSTVKQILRKIILSDQSRPGFVLDGAPRVVSQVDEIEDFTRKAGQKVDWVILVEASDQACLERLLKRGRKDDHEKVIKNRLNLYHQEQGPVIDYFDQKGILIRVDGERPIKKIHQEIVRRLKDKN